MFMEAHRRCPTRALDGMTPYEAWYGKKPSVSHLRVFGSTAYVHVQKAQRKHLQSHTVKCVMVGYQRDAKAWRLWDPVARRLRISRDVIFDETPKPLSRGQSSPPAPIPRPPELVSVPDREEDMNRRAPRRPQAPPEPPWPVPCTPTPDLISATPPAPSPSPPPPAPLCVVGTGFANLERNGGS